MKLEFGGHSYMPIEITIHEITNPMILSVVSALLVTIITGVVAWVAHKTKHISKMMMGILECQRATARAKLVSEHDRYMERGWMCYEQRKTWQNLYDSYLQLGEDNVAKSLKEELHELPMNAPKESENTHD